MFTLSTACDILMAVHWANAAFARALLVAGCLTVSPVRGADNPVIELNRKLQSGDATLAFEGPSGYLRAVLNALAVPIESQIVVFSKTSLMGKIITPQNPRTLFFNDTVFVGWVRGEPFVELAVADPQLGLLFYVVNQRPDQKPFFFLSNACRQCHESFSTHPIPWLRVRSVFPAPDGTPIRSLGDFEPDQRSPFKERWGGWYVTGNSGTRPHLGNAIVTDPRNPPPLKTVHLDTLTGSFDTGAYLSPHSDVVALMVFEHQMHLANLLTKVAADVRFTTDSKVVGDAAREIADYMLFVGEAPLAGRIQGSSRFAEVFAANGPRDEKGRGLRQFDLRRRLMRYPCSYMIYTALFDGLPAPVREAIYKRMWQILSREDKDAKYARLARADRQAIVEILTETKAGLPEYFRPIRK